MSKRPISRRGFFAGASLGLGAGVAGTSGYAIPAEDSDRAAAQALRSSVSKKSVRNAKTVLKASCRAKKGETLLILGDSVLLPHAPAIAEAAIELGLVPAVMDIRHYLRSTAYKNGYVLESVKAAMESSDIVIQNLADTWVPNRPSYGRLSGDPDMQDKALSGERRWMILQCGGLDAWDVTVEQISAIADRTKWLVELLRNATSGHVISPAGTDFVFGLEGKAGLVPVLGIIPFYGEVAVMPVMESTSGVFVIDGPTQRKVRPANELEREPLRVTVESGRAVNLSGDPTQLQRLKKYIASGDPPGDAIDEVGILTTTLKENDLYYWSDGTHHHDRTHIALGNNVRRDVVVHGQAHMDGEVCKPTISIDGLVIVKDGVFQDDAMHSVASHSHEK